MRDAIPTPRPRRARTAARALLPVLALAVVTACGGGGGGILPPGGPAAVVDGLAGHVLLPDHDLGRVCEQEPDDSSAQPFRVPPVWPRCRLEVTGELGTGALWRGRADPVDVLLLQFVRGQSVDLELAFPVLDPVSGAANDFTARVVRRATGVTIATTGAGVPRSLTFQAAADEEYLVVLTAAFGHGAWTLALTGTDLPAAPPLTKPAALTAAAAPPAAALRRPAPAGRRCSAEHVLVRLRAGCDAETLCADEGLVLGRSTGAGSYRVQFAAAAGQDGEAAAADVCRRLAARADVAWAEPDWIVRPLGAPGDPEFNRQWNLRAVGAPAAWDVVTGNPSVVVAVVDSGIAAHPDLAGAVVSGYDFVSDPSVAIDGDGRDADPTDPGDQGGASGLSTWHGTHVASIIAGRQDAQGMSGVAPGCRVMMLRALGVGGGLVSDAADAILYASGQLAIEGHPLPATVRVINLSIGLDQDSAELRDACERAFNTGCFLVAAVGNNGGPVLYPAAYPSTFGVAAVDGSLLTTAYSNFGSTVDLAAPGGGSVVDQWDDGWPDGVLGAVIDETVDPAAPGLGYLVGTSQAAPHVAGAAALMLSLDPTLQPADLVTLLRASAFDLGPAGDDVAYGAGLLQVHEAVKLVRERLGSPVASAARLELPTPSVQFEGLRTALEVPLFNGGGGRMNVFFLVGETDDGAGWLGGTLLPDTQPDPPVNMKGVRVEVDRGRLPLTPGRHGGTLVLSNSLGVQGTLRVVVYVGQRTRAGELLPVAAIEGATGIARRRGYALPEFGYRFWFRHLPTAAYLLQAGEDLDRDGFFCEAADACGWLGGPTEAEASPVQFVQGLPAVQGLSIDLAPPP